MALLIKSFKPYGYCLVFEIAYLLVLRSNTIDFKTQKLCFFLKPYFNNVSKYAT